MPIVNIEQFRLQIKTEKEVLELLIKMENVYKKNKAFDFLASEKIKMQAIKETIETKKNLIKLLVKNLTDLEKFNLKEFNLDLNKLGDFN